MRGTPAAPAAKDAVSLFPAKGSSDLVPAQFLLPRAQRAALKRLAFERDRSMSDLVREALEDYLARQG